MQRIEAGSGHCRRSPSAPPAMSVPAEVVDGIAPVGADDDRRAEIPAQDALERAPAVGVPVPIDVDRVEPCGGGGGIESCGGGVETSADQFAGLPTIDPKLHWISLVCKYGFPLSYTSMRPGGG